MAAGKSPAPARVHCDLYGGCGDHPCCCCTHWPGGHCHGLQSHGQSAQRVAARWASFSPSLCARLTLAGTPAPRWPTPPDHPTHTSSPATWPSAAAGAPRLVLKGGIWRDKPGCVGMTPPASATAGTPWHFPACRRPATLAALIGQELPPRLPIPMARVPSAWRCAGSLIVAVQAPG